MLRLKPAQERAVSALTAGTLSELTRASYERIGHVSRSQAAYDLAELVAEGVLERVGVGRATRYRLARPPIRKRRWTEDQIRTELTRFCEPLARWPTPAEFKRAGRGDLYVAASRYGGIPFWIDELGLASPQRARHVPVRRRRIALAAICLSALAAVALAGSAFVTRPSLGVTGGAAWGAAPALEAKASRRAASPSSRPVASAERSERERPPAPVPERPRRSTIVASPAPPHGDGRERTRRPTGVAADAQAPQIRRPTASTPSRGYPAPLPAPSSGGGGAAAEPDPLPAP